METEILTNQDVTTQNAETEQAQKTFTQDEVNRIVADRVADFKDYKIYKEKAAKYDEQVEASKSELQKATERADSLQAELDALKTAEQIRNVRDEFASAKGIPASLLTGSTAEECESQADAILNWAQKPSTGYPKAPDGGDPIVNKSPEEQFAEWFNAQV